jgi:YtkA-like
MSPINRWLPAAVGLTLMTLTFAAPSGPQAAGTATGPALRQAEIPEYSELPGFGKKCRIDDQFQFTYEFTEKPKMGTAILRIRIIDREGNQTTALTVLGRSDMPAMAGGHDSGDQEFKLNKKGDYLLPVNIVMPGEWEVKLTFKRGDDAVFRGLFRFDV